MEILKVFKENKEIIKKIKESLEKGKIIVFPTDTVYGLICNARNEKATKKIFKIKKREKKKPLGIFVRNIKMAKKFAEIDKEKEKFLEKIWPGKMTIIFKRKGKLPKILFGKQKTIGIRIPDYKLIKDLFFKINFPLAQTSANISGKEAPTDIKKVLAYFRNQKEKPDLILDKGVLKKAKASTVLDLSGKTPKILRKGEISEKNILKLM